MPNAFSCAVGTHLSWHVEPFVIVQHLPRTLMTSSSTYCLCNKMFTCHPLIIPNHIHIHLFLLCAVRSWYNLDCLFQQQSCTPYLPMDLTRLQLTNMCIMPTLYLQCACLYTVCIHVPECKSICVTHSDNACCMGELVTSWMVPLPLCLSSPDPGGPEAVHRHHTLSAKLLPFQQHFK